MANPKPLQSELTKSNTGRILIAHPKKPVSAVCQQVKDAVPGNLNCRRVKPLADYQRVGEATARKIPSSFEVKNMNQVMEEGNVSKAHVQEKKAKSITYKKGNDEITLNELFLIQNGEKHG